MATQIYALANQKGGVGKTTSCISLGSALKEQGKKVLLIDMDPQGSLSAGLGIDPLSPKHTIYDALDGSMKLLDILTDTKAGLTLAPANIDLSGAEIALLNEPMKEILLKEAIQELPGEFDYILIDCPPSLGLLTLNALTAATHIIIPVQCHYFALRGMELLLTTIKKVQKRINKELKVAWILPTMFDARTTHAKEVVEELRKTYGKLVFKTPIKHTIKFADSTVVGQSILEFQSSSDVADAYRQLAKEIINNE